MQRLKILGLALMAVFVLSAVVSATASASHVSVLPENAETWKGESGEGSLETLEKDKIVCKKDTSEGTIEAKKPLGLFHIHFEGCEATSKGLKGPCSSLDHKISEKTILVLGTYHLVLDKLPAEPGVGILFLIEHVHLECEILFTIQLVLILGEVLCLIKPVDQKAKHFEIVCKLGSEPGDPGETVYWDEKGKEVKMGLEGLKTAVDDKTYVMSGESTTALILTPNLIEIMS